MRMAIFSAAALLGLATAQPPPPPGGSWLLTFEDDFVGTSLNESRWSIAPPNRTQDAGHSVFIPSAVSVADGNLIITATHEPYIVGNVTRNFTGGWIDSRNKFMQRGGRWEVRAKLPPTSATCSWPAFWLLPGPEALCWPIGGEVDIMEYVAGFKMQHNASEPSAIGYGLHHGFTCYNDASIGNKGVGGSYPNVSDASAPVIDFSSAYHVFGAILNDTTITYYVDDVVTFVLTPIPQSEPAFTWGKTPYVPFSDMYAIINFSMCVPRASRTRTCDPMTNNYRPTAAPTPAQPTAARSRRQRRAGQRRTSSSSITCACTSGSPRQRSGRFTTPPRRPARASIHSCRRARERRSPARPLRRRRGDARDP
jgi:beta-glucanase (GH16 family)